MIASVWERCEKERATKLPKKFGLEEWNQKSFSLLVLCRQLKLALARLRKIGEVSKKLPIIKFTSWLKTTTKSKPKNKNKKNLE